MLNKFEIINNETAEYEKLINILSKIILEVIEIEKEEDENNKLTA
ncbi:hypothetical protein [Clostridium sp.]